MFVEISGDSDSLIMLLRKLLSHHVIDLIKDLLRITHTNERKGSNVLILTEILVPNIRHVVKDVDDESIDIVIDTSGRITIVRIVQHIFVHFDINGIKVFILADH
jgi:hypothetical protein